MAAKETPAAASSSRGQALQMEATDAVENLDDKLKVIDDGFTSVQPRDFRRDDPMTVVKATVHDPQGLYSAELDPHCIAPSAPVIQTGNSTDQKYKDHFQLLEFVPEKDDGYLTISHNITDPLEDCDTNHNIKLTGVDEDDQVDGESFDQNNLFPGTKATDKAENATPLQQNVDFSPTATAPNGISVPKVTTPSFESLRKPKKVAAKGVSVDDVDHTSSQIVQNSYVGTEVAIQTEDDVNIPVTAQEKEDEENGGRVLDKLKQIEVDTDKKFVSTFDAVKSRPAPGTGVTTPTTPNDVRLAVPSLEPLAKRAKVNEDEILVNVERASSSSSAARP